MIFKGRSLLNRINDIPIRQKFILIYLVLILMPMIMIYGIFYTQLRSEVELREKNLIDQSIERVKSDIEYIMEACFVIARNVAIDQNFNVALNREYESTADYFNVYTDILKEKTTMYATGYNNVIRVSVYADNENLLDGGNIYKLDDDIISTEWFTAYGQTKDKVKSVVWIEPAASFDNVYYNRVSIVRRMNEFKQLTKETYVRIDVEDGGISKVLQAPYDMKFIITDMDNMLIASDDTAYRNISGQREYVDLAYYQKAFHVISEPLELADGTIWYIHAVMPKQGLTELLNRYGGLLLSSIAFSLLLSILVLYIFSGSYNKRIQLLKKHMYKIEKSNFITIDGDHGRDEIGALIISFNNMTRQISGLINEVYAFELRDKEHQLEQVKAELKFLQSQMDPHFLFNTLNAILVVSSRKGYEDITQIIKYLSKTLRYLIEWDDSMVPLEKELAFTNMYLEIEKFRFRDKFDFAIQVEDGLEKVLLPKLSVQPFIENACKHGIQATKDKGELVIRAFRKDNMAMIVIRDNGIGMTKDQLSQIVIDESDSHIGINNVKKRLAINYQMGYIFDIKSEKNVGTQVTIGIPMESEVV